MAYSDLITNSAIVEYVEGLDAVYKRVISNTSVEANVQKMCIATAGRITAAKVWIKGARQWILPPTGFHVLDKHGDIPVLPPSVANVIFPPFPRNVLYWKEINKHGEQTASVISTFSQVDDEIINTLRTLEARPSNTHGVAIYDHLVETKDYDGWMYIAPGLISSDPNYDAPAIAPSVSIIFHKSALEFGNKSSVIGGLEADETKIAVMYLDNSRDIAGEDDNKNESMRWALSVIWVIIDLCITLAGTNVQRRLVTPPEKLNKKRIKNGKLPYSEFYVIDIKDGNDKSTSASRQLQEETHETTHRRLHTRRQHIRTYKNGTWTIVRAHEVGRYELGTIVKGYRISA